MTTTTPPADHQDGREGHADLTPTNVPAWMTIEEARGVFAAAGRHAVPVSGPAGLIGLITIEALAGYATGSPAGPISSVMDWHLVQVPADADDATTLLAFATAARVWLSTRDELDDRTKVDAGPHAADAWPTRTRFTGARATPEPPAMGAPGVHHDGAVR